MFGIISLRCEAYRLRPKMKKSLLELGKYLLVLLVTLIQKYLLNRGSLYRYTGTSSIFTLSVVTSRLMPDGHVHFQPSSGTSFPDGALNVASGNSSRTRFRCISHLSMPSAGNSWSSTSEMRSVFDGGGFCCVNGVAVDKLGL